MSSFHTSKMITDTASAYRSGSTGMWNAVIRGGFLYHQAHDTVEKNKVMTSLEQALMRTQATSTKDVDNTMSRVRAVGKYWANLPNGGALPEKDADGNFLTFVEALEYGAVPKEDTDRYLTEGSIVQQVMALWAFRLADITAKHGPTSLRSEEDQPRNKRKAAKAAAAAPEKKVTATPTPEPVKVSAVDALAALLISMSDAALISFLDTNPAQAERLRSLLAPAEAETVAETVADTLAVIEARLDQAA